VAIVSHGKLERVAQAEADAERIKALSQIETQMEVAKLTQRALGRFLAEETKKQHNMESITSKAIPLLQEDSKPQEIEDDWITNFFDKCRLISDEEMQTLWSKVLAGEANFPGKYSRRTINFLASLDKSDATLFDNLCRFVWFLGEFVPLIYEDGISSIYSEYGITFEVIKHLADIGLISVEHLTTYTRFVKFKQVIVFYYDFPIIIDFVNKDKNGYKLVLGKVLLSKIGQELSNICGSEPVPGFIDYVIKRWIGQGLILSSPYPKISVQHAK